MSGHGRAAEYLEGLLGPDGEAAFLDHAVDCAACQAALGDELQLRDREEILREAAAGGAAANDGGASAAVAGAGAAAGGASTSALATVRDGGEAASRGPAVSGEGRDAKVVPIESRRRWRHPAAIASIVVGAAAAAGLLWLATRPRPGDALALAPTRPIETRIGHPQMASYRPYEVTRGDAAGREAIATDAIARLDRAGDCRGVAAAYVLSGELVRAEDKYAKCPASAALDADRAGLAVLRGQPAAALELADHALAAGAERPVALWNRALALRDLGLGLAAAEDLEEVARLDPAWAKEADARAAAARREIVALHDSWDRLVKAGFGMVAGGPPIPADLARAHPGRARVFLHHAIRTARTPARLDELRPLAATLEGLAGTAIARHIDRAAAGLGPARLALVDEYAAMVAKQGAPDAAAFGAWLGRARAAGAADLVLGALEMTGRLAEAPDEAARLAAGDPWFELAVLIQRATAARKADRVDEAVDLLDQVERRCAAGAPAYRCLQLAVERAQLEKQRYHPTVVHELGVAALRDATAIGEWPQRLQAVHLAAEAARFRDQFSVARGFYREYGLDDEGCLARRRAAAFLGELSFDEHRVAEARRAATSLPACNTRPELTELELEADLLHAGAPVRDRAALVADLDDARARADAALRPFFDYLIARAELGHAADAPARLRALAADGLARPADTVAARVATASTTAAIAFEGGRGAWAEVLAIAAAARGLPAPGRCALALAADDFELALAAIGPGGEVTGAVLHDVVRPAEWLAPASLREQLRGCELVDVLASPPWLGVGPLLDPSVPWRYVLGPTRAAAAAGSPRRVIVADPRPPARIGVPALAPWPAAPTGAELITAASATPERLAAAARDATILEIHAHAVRVADSDAPALALSEGRTGWAVTAEAARALRLERAPVVVLADCIGAVPARYAHTAWGLPAGFLGAGARSVIAALVPIPDAAAGAFFSSIVAEIERGAPVAAAVARARTAAVARDPASWTRHVVVFE